MSSHKDLPSCISFWRSMIFATCKDHLHRNRYHVKRRRQPTSTHFVQFQLIPHLVSSEFSKIFKKCLLKIQVFVMNSWWEISQLNGICTKTVGPYLLTAPKRGSSGLFYEHVRNCLFLLTMIFISMSLICHSLAHWILFSMNIVFRLLYLLWVPPFILE